MGSGRLRAALFLAACCCSSRIIAVHGRQCFNSDDGDVTAQCRSAGANCCTNDDACRDFMGVVCDDGCRGAAACRDFAGFVSSGSCHGPYACAKFRGAISAGSCVGEYACYDAKHIAKVGGGSCQGMLNCAGGIPPELTPEERKVAEERLEEFERFRREQEANATATSTGKQHASQARSGEL